MRFQKFLYKFLCGTMLCAVLTAPLSAYAAQNALDVDTEMQNAYEKTIESNEWESWPTGPSVYAESAIVMEADTGTILYAKDIEEANYPASITKIMTALVTLEHCDLSEEVEFSYYATHSIEYGSSSIARTEGEILTVEETLYALMLSSANECANALAEHVAGSNEAFAELMNQKAAELGCVNTHFANPSGLHNDAHYTCAYDMALITRAAIQNEDFRRISGTSYYTLRSTNKNSEELWMQNHHNMIAPYKTTRYLDDTIFAGKTGYTTDALNTLVTCGTRNGMDVIVITMRTRSTAEKGVPLYTDTAALLDYANNFQKLNISEHEKTFVVGNSYDFSVDSDDSAASGSLISIDRSSYVVLPNTVTFDQAVPSVHFTEESSEAFLSYEYAGQTVGKAMIFLESSDPAEATPFPLEREDTDAPQFIVINLKLLAMALTAIAGVIVLCVLIYRIYKKNRIRLRKAVALHQKRFSMKRRRRRLRRRRR